MEKLLQDIAVNGYYKYKKFPYEMYFDEFDFGGGQISAKGRDKIGSFTMQGNFNAKGNSVKIVKHYIDQEQDVDYSGQLVRSRNRKGEEIFKIQGKWQTSDEGDDFLIEFNTHSTKKSMIMQTITLQKNQFHFAKKDKSRELSFVLNPRD